MRKTIIILTVITFILIVLPVIFFYTEGILKGCPLGQVRYFEESSYSICAPMGTKIDPLPDNLK